MLRLLSSGIMSALFPAFQNAPYQQYMHLQDNDERLASLVQLSSIPVDDILRQLVSEASPTSPEREMMIKRVVSVHLSSDQQ